MFCPDDAKKVKKSFLEERTKHREDRELHRKRTDSAIRIEVQLSDSYRVVILGELLGSL